MSINLIGQTLGKYRILEEIGRGGMGSVYKAHDTVLDRIVAIKVLAPHLTWDQQFVQRFLHEARAAARLKHPHIVTIHDVDHAGGYHFIVMDYLEGQPLSTLIRRERPLAPERAARILGQIAQALDYAHAQGLVHRDVKPGNVIVGPDDHATLTDFGVAKALAGTRLTQTGTLLGTPAYMAPEQVRGQAVGPSTDVYALAVVAYEMLGGRPPFQGETAHVLHAHAYEPPPPLRQVNPRVSEAVAAVVHKALAKDSRQRYPTTGAFAAALGQATGSREAESARKSPPRRPPSPPVARTGQTPLWPLFGVLGAAILLIALVFGIGRSGGGQGGGWQVTPTPAVTITRGARGATVTPVMATLTATPAHTPTATHMPTSTVTRTLTATPTATNTATSTPAMPTAITTKTPTPTSSPTATCPPVGQPFHELRARRPRLGCAISPATEVWTAFEPFEHGFMVWREDKRHILAAYDDRRWTWRLDAWREAMPEFACLPQECPPTPKRGFGKVWCENPEIRNRLGKAIECESGTNSLLQDFERGMIWRRLDSGEVFIFYADGTWERP